MIGTLLFKDYRPLKVLYPHSAHLRHHRPCPRNSIVVEYFQTGLVPASPRPYFAASFMFLCGLSLATGLILDSVAKKSKENNGSYKPIKPIQNKKGSGLNPDPSISDLNTVPRTLAKSCTAWHLSMPLTLFCPLLRYRAISSLLSAANTLEPRPIIVRTDPSRGSGSENQRLATRRIAFKRTAAILYYIARFPAQQRIGKIMLVVRNRSPILHKLRRMEFQINISEHLLRNPSLDEALDPFRNRESAFRLTYPYRSSSRRHQASGDTQGRADSPQSHQDKLGSLIVHIAQVLTYPR